MAKQAKKMRRAVTVVALVSALGLSIAAVAWACTVQPRVFSVTPAAGQQRTSAAMKGEGVRPMAPVEVRWNALEGQMIGAGTADAEGRYSVPVTIPDAAPGVYSMVLVVGDPAGEFGVGRTSFEVSPAPGTTPAVADAQVWPTSPSRYASTSPSGASRSLMAGLGLLSVGLLATFATVAVAATRRRRVRSIS